VTGSGRNSLREVLQERGWSYTRLAAELRRHAAGSQLPKTESLVTLIRRWVNNHQQPDDFYRDLLAKALGRSRGDLFGGEGVYLEPSAMAGPAELPHDLAGFIGRSGEIDELRRRLLGTGHGAGGAIVTIDGAPGVGKSALLSTSPTSYASTSPMRNCSPTCGATRARGSTRPSFYTSSCVPLALPVTRSHRPWKQPHVPSAAAWPAGGSSWCLTMP
jgi:hypothetical protein